MCLLVNRLYDLGSIKEHGGITLPRTGRIQKWMAAAPEQAGTLYIDGHVRVYNGSQTKLPRHYVARQRLCLRATTDYWVNAMDGQPFFVVNTTVDPGLISVIEKDIVPRLERDIPQQP